MIREWDVQRRQAEGETVLGAFTLDDGRTFCSLERRDVAVTPGRYRLTLTVSQRAVEGTLFSPHQDHKLPLLNNVEGRRGIRVHALSHLLTLAVTQTDGCIGVGEDHSATELEASRPALTEIVDALQLAENAGDQVWVTVRATNNEEAAA